METGMSVKNELGILMCLNDEDIHSLKHLEPITREDADDYLATVKAASAFLRPCCQSPYPQSYWVPLSAFVPLKASAAKVLTADMLQHSCPTHDDTL